MTVSRTGIIATLGPSTDDPEVFIRLVEAGASIFRLNFSHGDRDDHARRIALVRDTERQLGRPLAIMADLPGPKIRILEVVGAGISVEPGEDLVLDRTLETRCYPSEDSEPVRLGCTWPDIVESVHAGQRVLINDGAIRMLATDVQGDRLWCRVTAGGLITSNKGINLPDSEVRLDVPTLRDRELAIWAIEQGVDLLAMSFVRSPREIRVLRAAISDAVQHLPIQRMPIIAKIEVPPAVEAAEAIIHEADAVMVARGDLGVEMDLARVPIIQKHLLTMSRELARPCIVATQMLQTMIDSPIPTRAEASDVAGAIFDGADAVMLSGETAIGTYPVVAVETMRRIADETEQFMAMQDVAVGHLPEVIADQRLHSPSEDSSALVAGIWSTVRMVDAKAIVVYSEWGTWSRLLSRSSHPVPIIAYTPHETVARQMLLCQGVWPEQMDTIPDDATLGEEAQRKLLASGVLKDGDAVIIVVGKPLESAVNSTRITIHRVQDESAST